MHPTNDPSQHRPVSSPRAEADASKTGTRPTGRPAASTGYAARLLALFSVFTLLITDRARAFLIRSLSPAKARALGLRANPTDIVDEFMRCLTVYAPVIHQKRLPGYGPMRARYGLDAARDIAASLDRYASTQPAMRGASAEYDGAMELTDAMRDDALTGLRNLAGDDPMANGRVRAVAEAQPTVDGQLRAMEQIAQELVQTRENVPAELLDDAGLTPEVLDAMQSATRDATQTRTSSQGQRLAQHKLRADLAEPCGRILHELQAMLRAARTARKRDRTIPGVTSWLVSRASAPRPAAATTPTAPASVPGVDPAKPGNP